MDEILNDVNASSEQTVDAQIDTSVKENANTEPVNAGTEISQPQTEKPVQSPEENAHFAEQRRAREAAETKAANLERDYSIARTYGKDYEVYSESDIAEKYGHLGINTLDEFKEAVRIEEMKANGTDPDAVKKYAEELPEVKEARLVKRNAENFGNFEKWHKENIGPLPELTSLPQSVIDAFQKGESMKIAFMEYDYAQMKARTSELENKQKAAEINKQNADSSTGSVTGNGNADVGHVSFEAFEANKNDQGWVKKNLTKIMESRAKW